MNRTVILAALAALWAAASVAPAAAQPAAADPLPAALRDLAAQDLTLARIGHRLTVANAPLCDERMPATGLVLHALAQYPASWRGAARDVFAFESPLSVEVVVPGAPAAAAGMAANDGIAAIAGVAVPQTPPRDDELGSALRDRFENLLIHLPAEEPVQIATWRGGKTGTTTVLPAAACRARFEVLAKDSNLARSNGEIVQLSSRHLRRYNEDEVAVIVAHELAHIVLHHRRRLAAAGVNAIRRSASGRDGRLNRRVEQEADLLSVHLLRNAGWPADLAPRFMRKHGGDFDGLLRSGIYPSPEARAKAMEAEIAAIPAYAPQVHIPPLVATRDEPLL